MTDWKCNIPATNWTLSKNGSNRDLYANSDWLGEGLRKHTVNNQLDINFRGGGKNLRYYTMLSYKNDYGILNDKYAKYSDRYSAQMRKIRNWTCE